MPIKLFYTVLIMIFLPLKGMALSCMPLTEENVDVILKGVVTHIVTLKSIDREKAMDFSKEKISVGVIKVKKGDLPVDDYGLVMPVEFYINNFDPWGGPYVSDGETRWFAARKNEKDGAFYIGSCEIFYQPDEGDMK